MTPSTNAGDVPEPFRSVTPRCVYTLSTPTHANDKFEVMVLNDPLSSSPKVTYQIDLFRAARTTRYEVVTIRD